MQPLIDFEHLVAVLGDAVVISDVLGNVILWNHTAENIFGFTPSEALGRSLNLIIPKRLQERHWAGYRQTMTTGETRYSRDVLRVPAMHKNGRTLSIAFTISLLYAPEHTVWAIVAVIRDETRHFAEEQNLRKRVAELEARLAT